MASIEVVRLGVMGWVMVLGMGGSSVSAADDGARASRRTPVVEVFEQCRDAVVNISSTELVEVRDPWGFGSMFDDMFDFPHGGPGGGGRQFTRTSVGSGFVIHPDGYIVTNAHVVARTNDRKATFADGRSYDAEVIALDTQRDLAVLKISVPPNDAAHEQAGDDDGGHAAGAAPGDGVHAGWPIVRLGRSDDLMVGETVIAIGNPLGYQHTVTAGVVSAIGRDLPVSRDHSLTDLIQTDASINPGNSGGPLLNVLGELIGVNTAIRGDAQNIGFAIPVDQLRAVMPELLDIERRYRIVMGMQVGGSTEARVTSVTPASPAHEAGVQVDDRVLTVDGRAVRDAIEFQIALIGKRAGERVMLTVERDGRERSATLVLAERPMPDGGVLAMEKLGLELKPLPEEISRELRLQPGTGLLVLNVDENSPAARLGIAQRDIVAAIDRYPVGSLDQLGQLLEPVKAGDRLAVTVLRIERRGKIQLRGMLEAR